MNKTIYIYDSRDEVNKKHPVITAIGEAEGWTRKALKKSHWIIIPEGVKDRDCGDLTDEEGSGIVEFKSFSDFVGTYTDEKEKRAVNQTRSRYETGVRGCVIIYGSEEKYKYTRFNARKKYCKENNIPFDGEAVMSGIEHDIEQAKDKLFRLAFEYPKVAAYHFVKDEKKAVQQAKSFLKKCELAPREYPIYNPYKNEHPAAIAAIAGFRKSGPKKARLFFKHPECNNLAKFGHLVHILSLEDFIEMFSIIKGLKGSTITNHYNQAREEPPDVEG